MALHVLLIMCIVQWVARYGAYQCKWDKGVRILVLFLGMEVITICALHDEADIDTRDDMTVFNRLISIPYLSAFRRWLRLLISGTCILCPRVRLWLTNRC